MKKRLLSILLCTAMVASLAVGCGGKKAEESTGDDGNETAMQRRRCAYRLQKTSG